MCEKVKEKHDLHTAVHFPVAPIVQTCKTHINNLDNPSRLRHASGKELDLCLFFQGNKFASDVQLSGSVLLSGLLFFCAPN